MAVQAARAYFLRAAAELKGRLSDGRRTLLGDDIGVPDLLLKTCLYWAEFVRIETPTSLESYSAELARRPAYGVAMKKNFTPASMAALTGAAG